MLQWSYALFSASVSNENALRLVAILVEVHLQRLGSDSRDLAPTVLERNQELHVAGEELLSHQRLQNRVRLNRQVQVQVRHHRSGHQRHSTSHRVSHSSRE